MGRTFAVAVVTALSLLLHACPCAAARPLSTRLVVSSDEKSALALAPSASEGAQWRAAADAAAMAGKWIAYPFAAGAVHYPGYSTYPEAKPMMMWAAGAPPALGAFGTGAGGQLVKAPPYVDVTQQEQVAMWASLLNPSHAEASHAYQLAAGQQRRDGGGTRGA